MTRRILLLSLACFSLTAAAEPPRKPKLIVNLAIDQFRYDYLNRFRANYTGGFKRLLTEGAVFTNAYYEHFPTVTAIGHATMLSGATPSVSGIVGNEWFDRETGKQVSSVSDDQAIIVGAGPGRGSSPRRLMVSTVGDELKMADPKTKVFGISSKDRSAILPAGRMADGAFWFDTASGNFVSSTYYYKTLPAWAEKFNSSRVVDQWLGKTWMPFDAKGGEKPYLTLGAQAGSSYYNAIDRSPFGNELIVLFAQAAIEAEGLGADDVTDILAVSFSANDRVGHSLGPDAPHVRDLSIQSDRIVGMFLDYLDKKIGRDNYVLVFTADHGVAPMPEVQAQRRMPGGRLPERVVLTTIQQALSAKYGEGDWLSGKSGPAPYFNYALIDQKKLSRQEVETVAAEAVRSIPHIYRVYTRTQLRTGALPNDMVDRRIRAGFHNERGSDLFVVSEPYWLFEQRGTSHGTPYNYDAHVPVIFFGSGVKAGRFHQPIAVNDIAPTLSTMLDVEPPSGSSGRVLHEILP